MRYSLSGPWQISPLTDLSIPQADVCFPAALSSVLPPSVPETDVQHQEWHLMHDIEVDESLLAYAAVDLVLAGIEYYAEIRLNGVAIFDCDTSASVYRKDIRPLLKPGKNRFEILFLEADNDWLIDENESCATLCVLDHAPQERTESRIGIWEAPYLQCIRYVRMSYLATEQIWHHGGGCELLVHIYFETVSPGLVSASVKFDGIIYHIPIDIRHNQASALFQIDAPRYFNPENPKAEDQYILTVQLDGQTKSCQIGLYKDICITHFPV